MFQSKRVEILEQKLPRKERECHLSPLRNDRNRNSTWVPMTK